MDQRHDTKRSGDGRKAGWCDPAASPQHEAATTQQFLTAIVNTTDDAVIAFDTQGRIRLWNRAAVALFGYTAEEAIGRGADLLVKPLGYIPSGETSNGAFDIVLAGGSFQRDTKRVAKDGTVIDVSVTASQVKDAAGRLIGVSAIMRDIREGLRCEAALRANEEGLRLALEAGGGGAWYWDVASDNVNVAASYRAIYGFPADVQVTKDVWLSAIHPEDRGRLHREVDELFRSGGEYEQEFRILHPVQGVRWLRGRGRLEFDAVGKPAQFYGIDIDITREKEIAKVLRHQREDLDAAQAVSQTGSWRLDIIRNELTWSAESHRIFGVPEGTRMTYDTFLRVVHPDDRAYVDQEWKAGLAGEHYDIEHRVVADGRVKWVRERATLEFDADGRLLGGFGTTQDITDRKLVADQLQRMKHLLAEGQRIAQLGSWEYIAATRETVWSDEEKRIYGLDASDESPTYEVMLRQYIHPEDAADLDRSFGNALRECAAFENENRIIRRDGTVRWIQNRAQPYFDLEGKLERYIGVTLDITERKEMFDALNRANAALEMKVAERTAALALETKEREAAQERLAHAQRLEATGRLAGGLAHDFNNTLTAIAAHLEFAETHIANAEAAESVAAALDAVELGASLNRRLLSLAASRKRTAAITAIDVPLRGVLSLISRTLGRDIQIAQRIDPDLWLASFDPGELESAVLNLMINARDSMRTGGTIVVEARNVTLDAVSLPAGCHASSGDFVRISVSDSGCGMPPEVKARAGEPFFSTKDVTKGTGLGLSSVNGFVSTTGGFMTIESALAVGTEVALFLPRATRGAAMSDVRHPIGSGVPLGDGELVLLVDDDERVLEATHKLLEGLGYAVINASSGEDAIARLRDEEAVQVVLCDIVMSGSMSGFDVARHVRSQLPNVKILLYSGYHHDYPDCEEEESILRKPFTRAEIARALSKVVYGVDRGDDGAPLGCTSPANT